MFLKKIYWANVIWQVRICNLNFLLAPVDNFDLLMELYTGVGQKNGIMDWFKIADLQFISTGEMVGNV